MNFQSPEIIFINTNQWADKFTTTYELLTE
jgi:hypothetical protein